MVALRSINGLELRTITTQLHQCDNKCDLGRFRALLRSKIDHKNTVAGAALDLNQLPSLPALYISTADLRSARIIGWHYLKSNYLKA